MTPSVLISLKRKLPGIVCFLALFLLLCACDQNPTGTVGEGKLYERDVSGGLSNTDPVHKVAEVLIIYRNGERYTCSNCHSYFTERKHEAALAGEHKDITFDHGRNVLCLNCHNPRDPDSFVAHGGGTISRDEPTELCSNREWRMGVHGRTNGYWSPEHGPQNRLDCIQCHNPHRPKFPKMKPEPPPLLSRFDTEVTDGIEDEGGGNYHGE